MRMAGVESTLSNIAPQTSDSYSQAVRLTRTFSPPNKTMRRYFIAPLGAAILPLAAQLQTDASWSYDAPQLLQSEPFDFEVSGNYLYAGGLFLNTEGVTDGKNFVRFDLTTQLWEQVPGLSQGLGGRVDTIVDGGDGFIYVGGNFRDPAGTNAKGIARFNPSNGSWESLTSTTRNLDTPGWENGPVNGRVKAIVRTGNYVYAGGNFANNNPSDERFILRYNLTASRWESVGSGTSSGAGTGGQVDALLELPNGDLIAATRNTAGLMRWDGSNWSTYAGGITGPGDSGEVDPEEASGAVRVMKLHPDGRIFIAGSFNAAGGISANFVAAYNPASNTWDNLNGGFGPDYLQSNGTRFDADGVYDLEIDSKGRVYVGGDFRTNPDGTDSRFNHIAMWDDTGAWKPLGSGIGSTGSQIVNCLESGPDGELYVGGVFSRGWRDAVSSSLSFAIWDDSQVLTPIPLSEDRPIITSENGTLYIHIRSIPGNQYKVQESSSLPFPPLENQFGRFGSSNWNLVKRELGPAPTNGGRKFYRVFVF